MVVGPPRLASTSISQTTPRGGWCCVFQGDGVEQMGKRRLNRHVGFKETSVSEPIDEVVEINFNTVKTRDSDLSLGYRLIGNVCFGLVTVDIEMA